MTFKFRYFVAVVCIGLMFPITTLAKVMMPYKQSFITTAYYSPLPDQDHYVTGSYYGDTRLNGNGTNGASGAEVFPGMLAAPKSYPFGFKIDIPGIGISEIQDRGGAIVREGVRGNAHDRLDIWMGAGETGLRRALAWGKRTVVSTVYGVRPELEITAGFADWDGREIELVKYWKENAPQFAGGISVVAKLFPKDLWFGQQSEKVTELQGLLSDMGYFFDESDGVYDDALARAIYHFQRDNDIVYDWGELGAGHFGPHTRVTIEKAKELLEDGEYVNQTAYLEKIQLYDDLREDFTAFTDELYLGEKGDSVRSLQEELISLGYLRTKPTGYYGEVTENAVKRFQMKMNVITSMDDQGAGVIGPKTRTALNGIFDTRIATKGMLAYKRSELSENILLASTDTSAQVIVEEVLEDIVIEETLESDDSAVELLVVEEITKEVVEEPVVALLSLGSRGDGVKELQKQLRALGHFNSGFVTTYFGEKTESALISFQLEQGIIATASDEDAGVLTEDTRQLLF